MDFKYKNNKEEINIVITKEEAEVITDYLLDRMIKLEDCKLKDSYCYPKIANVYYRILKGCE